MALGLQSNRSESFAGRFPPSPFPCPPHALSFSTSRRSRLRWKRTRICTKLTLALHYVSKRQVKLLTTGPHKKPHKERGVRGAGGGDSTNTYVIGQRRDSEIKKSKINKSKIPNIHTQKIKTQKTKNEKPCNQISKFKNCQTQADDLIMPMSGLVD